MSKLLIILAIVIAAIWYFRRQLAPPRQRRDSSGSGSGSETVMVRCAQCDLYLPPANATPRGGRWYCEKHR
jgi:hypothetical protein